MNWDAIGAVGEVVGALAVVVSLIYLAGQIRHNNHLAQNNSLQSVLASEMNFASIIMDNALLWDRLIAGESFSDREERRKATILYNLYLLDSANRYYQFKTGYLKDESWEGRQHTLHELVKWPMFEVWRSSLGARGHSKDFLQLMDKIREEELGTDQKQSNAQAEEQ